MLNSMVKVRITKDCKYNQLCGKVHLSVSGTPNKIDLINFSLLAGFDRIGNK